jgi:hypothetical protein
VTSNHDMILLCEEEGESVVWVDPRGRQFRSNDLVLLLMRSMEEVNEMLKSHEEPICARILRTRVEVLSLERAGRLARRRIREIRARHMQRARAKTAAAQMEGVLFTEP